MREILRTLELLDKGGYYKTADHLENQLIKLSAFPYNLVGLDELPLSARNSPWRDNEEDYEEYDRKFFEEFRQRIPDYRTLKTAPDELNMEGKVHGEDTVPGPAYVDPGNLASSPSMNGSLDYFTWEQAHDANQGPEYWKNLTPRR